MMYILQDIPLHKRHESSVPALQFMFQCVQFPETGVQLLHRGRLRLTELCSALLKARIPLFHFLIQLGLPCLNLCQQIRKARFCQCQISCHHRDKHIGDQQRRDFRNALQDPVGKRQNVAENDRSACTEAEGCQQGDSSLDVQRKMAVIPPGGMKAFFQDVGCQELNHRRPQHGCKEYFPERGG